MFVVQINCANFGLERLPKLLVLRPAPGYRAGAGRGEEVRARSRRPVVLFLVYITILDTLIPFVQNVPVGNMIVSVREVTIKYIKDCRTSGLPRSTPRKSIHHKQRRHTHIHFTNPNLRSNIPFGKKDLCSTAQIAKDSPK